jgi:phosphohistidine phosphatase
VNGRRRSTTKTLYLLRHAKSSWKDESLDDFDRPLNKRGRRAAMALGTYLARASIAPAQVLCSSAKRTRETMDIIQAELKSVVPIRFEKGIYLADSPSLLRRLKRLNDSLSSVMLVGHNPGLERLALMLIAESDDAVRRTLANKFPTGSLAVIESDVGRWADLKPGCGRLGSFVKGRDLGRD